jgi:hypothetical protein
MKKIFLLLLSCVVAKSCGAVALHRLPARNPMVERYSIRPLSPLLSKRTQDFGPDINASIDGRYAELNGWRQNNAREFAPLKIQEIRRLEKEIENLIKVGLDAQKIEREKIAKEATLKAQAEKARIKTSETITSPAQKSISDLMKEKKDWEDLLKNERDASAHIMFRANITRIDGELKKAQEKKKQEEQEILKQKLARENALKNSISFDPEGTLAERFLGNANVGLKKESSAGTNNNCLFYSIYQNRELLEKIVDTKRAKEILSFRGLESNLNLQDVRKVVFDKIISESRAGFRLNVLGFLVSIEEFLEAETRNARGRNPLERLENWLNDLYVSKRQIPIQIATLISHIYEQPILVFKEVETLEWSGNLLNIRAEIDVASALIPERFVHPFLPRGYNSFKHYMDSSNPSNKDKVGLLEKVEKKIRLSRCEDRNEILNLLEKIKKEFKKPALISKKLQLADESYGERGVGKEPILVYFSGGWSSGGHYEKLRRLPH